MESNKIPKPSGKPSSEINIDSALVFDLLTEQHSDLNHLPIQFIASGWDNAIFRLGDRLCIRLPRRKIAAKLIEQEQTWLPIIASRLAISVPTPYRLGKPTANYPWCWSILPWFSGVTAEEVPLNSNQAKKFGSFLRSLHLPAPPDAPLNPFRGVPLQHRADAIEDRIRRLKSTTNLITSKIENIWYEALNTPIDITARWLHGDLHPGNILVENGEICGIIDWGDLTSGDVATDLASIWMLFPERDVRHRAIAEYSHISNSTLQRAKGWAIYFGIILLDVGLCDCPQQATIGARTLRCVAED